MNGPNLLTALALVGLVGYGGLVVVLHRSNSAPERFVPRSSRLAGPGAGAFSEAVAEHTELAERWLNDRSLPAAERIHGYRHELGVVESLLVGSLGGQPAQARALARLAAVRWELDPPKTEEAMRPYVEMIRLASEMAPRVPGVQLQIGELLLEMGRRGEAKQYLRRGVELDPTSSGKVVEMMGRKLIPAEEILAGLPRRPAVLTALRAAYLAEGDEGRYLDAVEPYLTEEPAAELISAYGMSCMRIEDHVRLKETMQTIGVLADPVVEAERLKWRSRAYIYLGRTELALEDAEAARKLQPQSAGLVGFAGQVLLLAGNADEAIGAFREALGLVARGRDQPLARASFYSGIGRAEESRGNPARAFDAYRMALRLDPGEAHAKKRLGEMKAAVELR